MIETIEPPVLVLGIVCIIIIIWMPIFWFALKKKSKPTYEPPALTDWRTTGVIDFIGQDKVMLSEQDSEPAQFTLRVQEQRQVANIAGSPTTEHRWRLATKAEAKDVVQIVTIYRKDK